MRIALYSCLYLLLATSSLLARKTEVKYLSGTGKDDTVNREFQCTTGRNNDFIPGQLFTRKDNRFGRIGGMI